MRASSEWFLHREGTHTVSTPITRLIERYGKGVAEIAREPHLYLNSASLSRYEERITELSALPPEVSSRIAFLDSVPDALELVYLQGKSGQSLYLVNQARLLLSEVLKVGELQEALTRADVRTKWEQQANSLARDELGRGLGKFVTAFLKSSDEESIEILKQGEGLNLVSVITEKPEHYFKNLISFSEHQDYLNIANQIILGSASPSAFYVLANRLRFLSSKVL
jgi:NAD-specific glutamate dehydrogenase